MSSFLVIKKNLELSAGTGARMLVGKQNRVIPEQILSESNSIVTTMKKHFDFGISYDVDPANGQPVSSFQAKFPSGKYDPLSAVPSYTHHRFLGWHTQTNDVTNEYAVTSGDQKVSSDNINCFIPAIYGNWQAATSVTLSSQMQNWNPEMGHDCYVGQQYGQLPSRDTHNIYDAEVEYLESTGTEVKEKIVLDYVPSENDIIKIGVYAISYGGEYYAIASKTGAWNATPNYWFTLKATSNFQCWTFSSYQGLPFSGYQSKKMDIVLDLPDKKIMATYDGILRQKTINVGVSSSVQSPLTLFDRGKWRIYYLNVVRNGVCVCNIVPVRVGSEGAMYDRVSGKLFRNQGTGNFSYGNDIASTPTAYRNLGWYTQQRTPDKTTTTTGSHVTSTSLVTYRPTLYALWQLPSDITFDVTTNGGSMQPYSHNYYMTQAYGELPAVDDRSHYYYDGWFTQASGGTKVTTTSIVPGDTTLYAQWSAGVTIIFDATTNGGQMPQDWVQPDYFAGHAYGMLPVPTHPRLNFIGWYLNEDPVDENSVVPVGGATLVAQYMAQTYTVDISNGDWVLQDPNTNPDPPTYNGVYQSDRYHGSPPSSGCVVKMYINTIGYRSFDVYIRSNGENGWSYTIAVQPDVDPSNYSEAMSNAFADTNGKATGTTSIDGYTKVTYELDGGSHRICIAYIHKDSYTVGDDRGYVLIPMAQSIDDGI